MDESNLAIEMQKRAQYKLYKDCLEIWEGGACNVGAVLRSIVRGLDASKVWANSDPAVCMALAHVAFLIKANGLGGFEGDLFTQRDVEKYILDYEADPECEVEDKDKRKANWQ